MKGVKVKLKVIVFDTETIGKVNQDLLNIGYKIVDINIQQGDGKLIVARDYVVRNLINNKVYCINDDFVGAKKLAMLEQNIESKKTIVRTLKQIYITLKNDIEKHGVLFGYAYNCKFDLDKFENQVPDGVENPFELIPVFDIWEYAIKYICRTPAYIEWATENEILTQTKEFVSTSVESVCKYLYNDLDFTEDHTALSDVNHELEILLECIRRGADVTRPQKVDRFIPSGLVQTETLVINKQEQVIEYKTKRTRKGKTYYSM